jgi:hypothetical protein
MPIKVQANQRAMIAKTAAKIRFIERNGFTDSKLIPVTTLEMAAAKKRSSMKDIILSSLNPKQEIAWACPVYQGLGMEQRVKLPF